MRTGEVEVEEVEAEVEEVELEKVRSCQLRVLPILGELLCMVICWLVPGILAWPLVALATATCTVQYSSQLSKPTTYIIHATEYSG